MKSSCVTGTNKDNKMNSKESEGIEMAINVIDLSQRKAAKVGGFTFLFAISIVVFSNYIINFRLISYILSFFNCPLGGLVHRK